MSPPTITMTSSAMLDALRDPANQQAWNDLDRRYRPIVEAMSQRVGLRHEDAADVAQQTLVDALGGFCDGKYDKEKGRLRSWILTIAHRRIHDVLRIRYRAGAREGDTALASTPAPDLETVRQAWDECEDKALLHEALRITLEEGQASESTKRAFELVMLRNVPEEAAAHQCGISVDQVYVAKHRMLKKLRETLEALQAAIRSDEWK